MMNNRASEEVREVSVVFPKLVQLMTERAARSPLETSLGVSDRDPILLDVLQPDLLWWGFYCLLENSQRVHSRQGFVIAFNVESGGKCFGC